MEAYKVINTTGLFCCDGNAVSESGFMSYINELIADGYEPKGGVVYYGNSGMMQAMYKAPPKTVKPVVTQLEADVKKLLDTFGHTHESNGIDDACAACNLDLRNPIHMWPSK